MFSINLVILIPFIVAALLPFSFRRFKKNHLGWFVLIVPTVLFVLLARLIPSVADGKTYIHTYEWIPTLDFNFTTYLDGLSMIFALLITGVGSLVILYSIFYLSSKESLQHFYCYLLLFMGAMLGVVFSDNLMVLYVFWELTSVSSFLLIAFWNHRQGSRQGAQKAMLITVSGGIAMLVGFIMLHTMTGSFSIREIIASVSEISDHALFLPAMILILLGAFTKSAQFPFHIWLPDAMEAPTPVSAYLHSATMVKAGIYLVARFTPVFGADEVWFWVVSIVGMITLFWGSFNAVRQTDLKALLAFSTVSQLGLIMSLLGLGSIALQFGYSADSVLYTQATFAALFHLINHSTFKGALFMVVGILDHELGTRDIRRLGGLMALMPFTFTVALIGSLSMAGLPPFNGFLSKEMFFAATVHIMEVDIFSLTSFGIIFPVVAWIASVLTFVYCMIIVFKVFLGKPQPEKLDKPIHEAPIGMLISPMILGALVVGIFFFPNLLGQYILQPAMGSIYPTFGDSAYLTPKISAWHGVKPELLMTIGVIIIGALLYKYLKLWKPFVYGFFPSIFTFNSLYNNLLASSVRNSNIVTNRYMNGLLRHYLVYIFVFFIVTVGSYLLYSRAFSFDISTNASFRVYEVCLVAIMAAAAVSMLFAKSRITATLLNGVLGYSIAIFFVLFRAPDLALTQLVVESVTTALFLLAFSHLPDWKKENLQTRTKLINGIVSVAVGLIVVLIGLSVVDFNQFDSISSYFEDAYELAGGANIVNAILGDFRGFDTMLEVVVLFIAGLGVYSMIKLRTKKEDENIEDQ
ncbi:multisubunit sodium/proton antiporter, MrpA subunit [Psychrobacillus sp. OK028]|uniref:Na+/H+ antiporter subunit A n=1 Tax=Psychrobacillus sp. OK028 TaxID=1884359 RepID=UPI00088D5884|nr:Na+/H+ antiporter subunit A [Psychrobacillus sp. OK028]SDN44281.1 multisubunit sodium/proton antiporter, MrpA subunit [Psychrobacillus sp. OK028]